MHTIRYPGSKKERCEACAKVGSCVFAPTPMQSLVSHFSGWTISPRWDRSHANPLPHLKILTSPHWRCCGWWDPVLSCTGWSKVFVYMPFKTGSSKEGNANRYIRTLKTCEQFFPLSETCSARSTEQFQVSTLSWTDLPDPFWANGEQLAQLRTILWAQELIPQDCSTHASENQRPNLPSHTVLSVCPSPLFQFLRGFK